MEFKEFNKIPRLSRDMVITEKIDGTNASVLIINSLDFYQCFRINEEECLESAQKFFQEFCLAVKPCIEKEGHLYLFAGSRTRWITPEKDNYGFASWVKKNAEELFKLDEGRHFGEWFGQGIQRKYGLQEKCWALFNVKKWVDIKKETEVKDPDNLRVQCPTCCTVVPILFTGKFTTENVEKVLKDLENNGSVMVPGFQQPEGIVIFHTASRQLFKKTIKDDDQPKGKIQEVN